MSRTSISSDRVHDFNRVTLAIDRELQAEFEVDLLIMPEELRRNSIVAAQWHTAGDKRVCPLCASLDGDVIPVDSPEWGRIKPNIHINCRCILSYITSRERGVQQRIDTYRPIDPDLLKKWSSKVYTDVEIREMVKAQKQSLIDFHANLTSEEQAIIKEYTGSDYIYIRQYMKAGTQKRSQLLREWGRLRYNQTEKQARVLQNLFRKYHDGALETELYRSLGDLRSSNYTQLKLIKTGDAIDIDKFPTSWSMSREYTEELLTGDYRVQFVLRKGRKKTKELDIARYAFHPNEQEVFMGTTRFRVTGISEKITRPFAVDVHQLTITLEEIP